MPFSSIVKGNSHGFKIILLNLTYYKEVLDCSVHIVFNIVALQDIELNIVLTNIIGSLLLENH